MWSHYGDSHRGVCIGFDIDRPFDPVFGTGYEVEYRELYPSISLLELDSILVSRQYEPEKLSDYDDISTRSFYTKSTHWSYENEIRYVRTQQHGTGVGSMEFPAQKIKEIILGAKISSEDYRNITALHENNFPHAKLVKLEISNNRYELRPKTQA